MITSFGIRTLFRNILNRPNKNALFIFGMPKSGTTVIASLIAIRSNKTLSMDTKYLGNPYVKFFLSGGINFSNHIKGNSHAFSQDIIKHPSTTFYIPILKEYFSLEKYIYIVRNPFDNIRSILNRLSIPGNLEDIDINDIPGNWKSFIRGNNNRDYITVLAKNWVRANSNNDIFNSKKCILVRYEDFNLNKKDTIDQIMGELGYVIVKEIDDFIDKQFQPKGNDNVDLEVFFGSENYSKIALICKDLIIRFNY